MAIVLVIIGLILGAVIKGKDVINSAKQKKFYTNFIKTWELSIASYYDRTGNVLGDGIANGGTAGTRDGRIETLSTAAHFTAIDTRLQAVGLEVPSGNTAANYQYTYSGVYSGSVTISMQMRTQPSATDGVTNNVLYFPGMPTDLALALDTIIDGQSGTTVGAFRSFPDTLATWPNADTTPTVNTMYIISVP
jgi:hypothetical protein